MKRAAVMWAARAATAQRLAAGSSILAARLTDRITAWIRAGRRDDLTGLAAVLGCILRTGFVLAGLWVLWRIIRAAPALLWAIVPAWCWAALRTTLRPAPDATPEAPQPDPREAVLRLLYDALGDRPAMHLSSVLQYLQKQGHGEGWTVRDLRARLEALHIPVELKVKAGGKSPTRGIVKANLPPLPAEEAPETSTAPSTAA